MKASIISASILITLLCSTICTTNAAIMSTKFEDCSLKNDNHYPYNTSSPGGTFIPLQVNATYDKIPLVAFVPTFSQPQKYPVIVFMHGSTAKIEMYLPNLRNYASHGFVVVFPYVKGPKKDTNPLTTNTNGEFILHGISYLKLANDDPNSLLYNTVDLDNIIVAGHSMGATCSIEAGLRLSKADNKIINTTSIKAVVTQHPGICGPFGPPPWPSTWLKSDLLQVNTKFPILFTTATNDGAFWPAPLTAKHELGCFNGAFESRPSTNQPATFVEFSSEACDKDDARPPFDDSGHNCAFKTGVETPWVLTFAKLYGQQGGDEKSNCWNMIYGGGMEKGYGVNVTKRYA